MTPLRFISIAIITVLVSISALVSASHQVAAGEEQSLVTKKTFNYNFDGKSIGEEFDISKKIEEEFKPNKICEQKNNKEIKFLKNWYSQGTSSGYLLRAFLTLFEAANWYQVGHILRTIGNVALLI